MGKMRNRKGGGEANRVNPVGIPSLRSLEKLEADGILEDEDGTGGSVVLQTIVDQLKSHLAEERDSALNTLSVAVQQPAYLAQIMESDVIKIVGPLLLDLCGNVRHSAAGALRNMSCGGSGVCDKMVKDGVMISLMTLLRDKYEGWNPSTSTTSKKKLGSEKRTEKIDSPRETFVQAVSLLKNLCENSSNGLKIFNRDKVADLLCKYLDHETYGVCVSIVVAQCLQTATEDNVEAVCNKSQLENCATQILRSEIEIQSGGSDFFHLKALCIGILLNLKNGNMSELTSVSETLKTISTILELDHVSAINKFSSEVPAGFSSNGSHAEIVHSKNEADDAQFKKLFLLEESEKTVTSILSSQILCLEIISNIMFKEEEDSSENEDSSSDMEDVEETPDVEMDGFSPEVAPEVYEGIVSLKIFDKVLAKLKSPPADVTQNLMKDKEHGRHVAEQLTRLKCTALLCLQNMIEGMQLADVEQSMPLSDIWAGLGQILVESEPSSFDVIEAVTSAIRAIIQVWTSRVSNGTTAISSDVFLPSFPVFHDVYSKVTISKVRVNIIKIIGGMGLLVLKSGGNSDDVVNLLTQVGSFLISCLSSKIDKEGLWMVAEALDTLFDVFSEDDYNQVLVTIGLIPKLTAIQPQLKKIVRTERRSLGEYRAVIQTANDNLPRFIQYKVKQGVS